MKRIDGLFDHTWRALDEKFGCLFWLALMIPVGLLWMWLMNMTGIENALRCIVPEGVHGGWTC